MASCVRNICAKNRRNPLILFKVTIDNIGVPFLRHSVRPINVRIIESISIMFKVTCLKSIVDSCVKLALIVKLTVTVSREIFL